MLFAIEISDPFVVVVRSTNLVSANVSGINDPGGLDQLSSDRSLATFTVTPSIGVDFSGCCRYRYLVIEFVKNDLTFSNQ